MMSFTEYALEFQNIGLWDKLYHALFIDGTEART